MTLDQAAECIIFGCLILTLFLSELSSALRRRRISAAMHLERYDDLVDKEKER